MRIAPASSGADDAGPQLPDRQLRRQLQPQGVSPSSTVRPEKLVGNGPRLQRALHGACSPSGSQVALSPVRRRLRVLGTQDEEAKPDHSWKPEQRQRTEACTWGPQWKGHLPGAHVYVRFGWLQDREGFLHLVPTPQRSPGQWCHCSSNPGLPGGFSHCSGSCRLTGWSTPELLRGHHGIALWTCTWGAPLVEHSLMSCQDTAQAS
mmetsp:Transcript_31940/g.90707  ORF Transcript_31940/g.90707 Transcript_31940/m.90707 type:complete len:206 (-) Transcript_31940:1604-2221(-)